MTHLSAAQKRKKRREQKLLEEEQQRVDEEKARKAPVSNSAPPVAPAAPSIPTRSDPDDPEPYDWYPPPNLPMFDASTLRWHGEDEPIPRSIGPRHAFPPSHPAANWPVDIQYMVYGPPRDRDTSLTAPGPAVLAVNLGHGPRDFSALRSAAAAHPWRTIRKRNHRLLPQRCERRPFPKSLPKRPVISAPRAAVLALHDSLPISTVHTPPLDPGRSIQPAHLLGLMPLHPDDPIHPDDVASIEMPAPSLCPCPADHFIEFPADTADYGVLIHQLAYACSRVLPPAMEVANDLCDVVWPPLLFPDGTSAPNPDARLDLLAKLPADHLVFLLAIAHMGHLEHHFALLFDGALTDFALAWVNHCELTGEAG
ncbi:hypothetical protein C8R47DRAFT_1223533 [Mycena vitilis]|nr:hypothetical protein C8R47DRAFT_1223533 [Mycena vitilis]